MLSATALYRGALARPHRRYVRAELWRAGVRIDPATNQAAADPAKGVILPYDPDKPGLPAFTTGNVRASLVSRVTRTLSLTMHERWYPWSDLAPFNPWGDELRVFAGLLFADGYVESFPIFTGRISKASRPDDGSFQVEASDLAAEVAGAGFAKPVLATVGGSIISEFQRLVRGGLPGATFGVSDTFTDKVPALIYDTDRGKALDDLAAAVGAFWFTLGDGSFVLRRIPWLQAATPLLTLSDGPDGVLIKAAPSRDRAGVYNAWTLVSERTDGQSAPIYAYDEDTDTASPIYVGGPFGRKAKTISVQGATTQGQLQALAGQMVSRGRSLAQSWTAEGVPDASLELGDAITVQTVRAPTGPVSAVQVVSGFTFPLTANGTMPLELRSQQPAGAPVLIPQRTMT